MHLQLLELRALEGPNIYYPQPAVVLLVRADRDLRSELTNRIKEWGQQVGVVIGYLRGACYRLADTGMVTQLAFVCSLPALGVELARGALADLQAAEIGDEAYSHDELLFQLIRRRQREAPPAPLLQLQAEALARQLPLFRRPDGRLQLGLGRRGWSFDAAQLSLGLQITPPWEQIARVPLLAVGGADAERLAAALAAGLQERGLAVALAQQGFDGARAAMAEAQAEALVLVVDAPSVLERGLPFDRCTIAVVSSLAGLAEPEERASSLHALVAVQHVVVCADEPAALALTTRAAVSSTLVSEQGLSKPLQAQLAAGGRAVWQQGAQLALEQAGQRQLLPATAPALVVAALAALDAG